MEIEGKKLARALIREVGEEVPLSKVLEEGSDWKGRREQLVSLKAQLQALKTAQVRAAGANVYACVCVRGLFGDSRSMPT